MSDAPPWVCRHQPVISEPAALVGNNRYDRPLWNGEVIAGLASLVGADERSVGNETDEVVRRGRGQRTLTVASMPAGNPP